MSEKAFAKAKIQPLMRDEIISLIEHKGVRRPAVCTGHWIHINELEEWKQPTLYKTIEEYPEDVVVFYLKKPALFDDTGNKYTWCDVPGADPSIGRTGSVAVDEENDIEWDVYDKISPECPDINEPTMFCNNPPEDGRYRLLWVSDGFWGRLWDYRGMTNSLFDLYEEPEHVHAVAKRVLRFFKAAIKRGVEEANIDGVSWGDDFGMQRDPFMSPEMWKEFYYPYFKEFCDYAHSLGLHTWLHCCGDCRKLIDMFIETGVDVLHPVQKYTMDEKEIAEKYGDRLTFWAGMDLQRIMPFGTVDEVKAEVRHFIDTFHRPHQGGLILTLNNRIQDNVPLENFVAYIEEAYRYSEEVGQREAKK
ncbi:MAG: hypothetical protein LBR25_08685 [Erysipelotrichaceae bacterium]|jgi:hypothetical protein|nr:hypothetical protein [Erysipelotrichaceae bacterium]